MSFAQQPNAPDDPQQIRELLRMFFGDQAAADWSADDPHGLLGLDPGATTPAVVITALQDRLAVLRLHPMADSAAGRATEAVLKQAASAAMLGGRTGTGSGVPQRISEIAAERKLADKQAAELADQDAFRNPPPPKFPQPLKPGDGETIPLVNDDDQARAPVTDAVAIEGTQVAIPPVPMNPGADPVAPSDATSIPPIATATAAAAEPVRARADATETAMNLLRQRAVMILTARGRLDVDAMRQLHAAALGLKLPISAAEAVVSEMARGGRPGAGQRAGTTMASAAGLAAQTPTGTSESVWTHTKISDLPRPVDDGTDPASVLLKRLIIGGGLVVMLSLSGLTVALLRASRSPASTGAVPVAAPIVDANSAPPAAVTNSAPAKPLLTMAIDRSSIVPDANAAFASAATLREISETRSTAPAQSEVSHAIVAFARSWPRMQAAQRTATAEHAIDAILRVDAAGQVALINALGAAAASGETITPSQIVEATGSAGLLGRLAREREFPASVRETIRKHLGNAGGGDGGAFDGAAAAVLRGIPLRLVAAQETGPALHSAWEAITLCGAALAGGTTARGDGAELTESEQLALREAAGPFLLEALEQLIRGGPNPLAVRAMHDSLMLAAEQLTWSPGSAARGRLINWFDDSSVPTVKLGIVTASIVQRSGAEGVDLTMAMSSSADIASRQEARARYAEAWKLIGGPKDATHQQLLVKLTTLAAAADSDAARLLVAAIAADVNRYFLASFTAGATSAVEPSVPEKLTATIRGQSGQSIAAFPTVSLAGETAQAMNMPASESASTGVRYFAERNTQARIEIIRQLDTRGTLDPVDADALIDAAAFGSSTELRALAARTAAKRSGEAILAASLLEALPRMARSRASAELISSVTLQQVPDNDSPEYPLAVRRAVVGRLIELLAAATPVTDVEGQAQKIADAYRASAAAIGSAIRNTDAATSAGSSFDAPSMVDVAAGNGPADAAQAVFTGLRSRALLLAPSKELAAAGLNLAGIDSRSAARATAATGPVRRFAGWQVSLLELTAFTAGADRPSAAESIGAVLADAAERRQRATGLAQQIMHTELTMVRIWLAWEASQ